MGRTSEIRENPAVKTLKWKNAKYEKKGKEKVMVRETGWYFWDKNGNDGEGQDVLIPIPITFLWLETAFSIMGYSEKREKGIYSNEILDLKTQPLDVKCDKETLAEGLYNDIKEEVKGQGGKFCSAVYALVDTEQGKDVYRFLMSGSANGAWIEFANNAKNRTHSIVCSGTLEKVNGNTEYEEPVFNYLPASDEDKELADQAYTEQIQPFFDYYLKKDKEVKDYQ